jgi:hypothetical protein
LRHYGNRDRHKVHRWARSTGSRVAPEPGERRLRGLFWVPLLVWLFAGACGEHAGSDSASLPDVDYDYFVRHIQPILEHRCAFFACHGSRERFLQIYQETRLRENPDPDPIFQAPSPLTPDELQRNFEQTAGMLYGLDDPQTSPLFSKPLQPGTRHAGATLFEGPDVFLNREDPDYQTLLRWARGARLPEVVE